jgi:acetyltransferase-like isoleucine patch superfamily enzyme
MSVDNRIPTDRYVDIEYQQFRPSGAVRAVMAVLGVLTWPLMIPLALLSRLSDVIFRSCSEFLSLIPYFPGVIARYEFYRFALAACGRNVLVEFGAVFIYRDVRIGSNVLIGRFTIVHHCDIGDYVLIGERCTFLSGSRQHRFVRADVPMALQGGEKRRISLGNDVWIGSHAVVMDDVANGAVVAAGSVVNKAVAPMTIVGGAPARQIGSRTTSSSPGT